MLKYGTLQTVAVSTLMPVMSKKNPEVRCVYKTKGKVKSLSFLHILVLAPGHLNLTSKQSCHKTQQSALTQQLCC